VVLFYILVDFDKSESSFVLKVLQEEIPR